MRTPWLLCLGVVFGVSAALGADRGARVVKQAVIPGGSTIVVVAEGDFEADPIRALETKLRRRGKPR
jgi:hypothetical protein